MVAFFTKKLFSATLSQVENQNNQTEKKPGNENSVFTKSALISFAFDLGFAIIIPLIIFALGGRLMDKKFHTSPFFLITGILISLFFTGYAVYKKSKQFGKNL